MEILSLGIIGILIVMSPGADFVMVAKNSVTAGKRAGLWTALGISSAIGVHVAYSMFGLSYLISHNQTLFMVIKYVGAGYLIYLGIKCLMSSPEQLVLKNGQVNTTKPIRFFIQGFFCNLLNPKTMLFFISLYGQLLESNSGNIELVMIYGLYLAALHWTWFSCVALAFSSNLFDKRFSKFKILLNRLCGASLMAFGAALAVKS